MVKCGFCGVVVPDDRVTFGGLPICKKCMLKDFGIKQSPVKIPESTFDNKQTKGGKE
jgi:hypothetical protein